MVGLQRAAVQDGCAGRAVTLIGLSQDHGQIMNHRLKTTGPQPAFGLLLDGVPGRWAAYLDPFGSAIQSPRSESEL